MHNLLLSQQAFLAYQSRKSTFVIENIQKRLYSMKESWFQLHVGSLSWILKNHKHRRDDLNREQTEIRKHDKKLLWRSSWIALTWRNASFFIRGKVLRNHTFLILKYVLGNSRSALRIRSSTFGPQDRAADKPDCSSTKALQVKWDPGDMKTGGEVVRRDLRAKPRCLQSRIEQTESAERCQAVRTEVFLFCYRPTPPEINTHLSSTGKQAAADVFNMELTNPYVCVSVCVCVLCVRACVCPRQFFKGPI